MYLVAEEAQCVVDLFLCFLRITWPELNGFVPTCTSFHCPCRSSADASVPRRVRSDTGI